MDASLLLTHSLTYSLSWIGINNSKLLFPPLFSSSLVFVRVYLFFFLFFRLFQWRGKTINKMNKLWLLWQWLWMWYNIKDKHAVDGCFRWFCNVWYVVVVVVAFFISFRFLVHSVGLKHLTCSAIQHQQISQPPPPPSRPAQQQRRRRPRWTENKKTQNIFIELRASSPI